MIAKRKGCTSGSAVEERASVARSVSAEPRHFHGLPVVTTARNRPGDDDASDDPTVKCRAETEFVDRKSVV